MSENENTEALVEMGMARRAAVVGLDPADLGAAYGYVLGKLTPHLSQTESGRSRDAESDRPLTRRARCDQTSL